MRFVALLFTMCTMAVLSTCAPAHNAYAYPQPGANHRQTSAVSMPPSATPIPQAARQIARPSASALNPARPLITPTTPAPKPNCAAVCVIDPNNGKILYAYNANQRRQVASTQKIITALCVCDEKKLDKMVTIQASDNLAPPIRLNLKPGTQYRKRDLLQAMLTGSFNDIAVALARDTAGSVDAFVARMNARARRMHMYDTHFANPNGLPADQYSTAHDMALAACYAYNNRIIRSCINIPEYDFRKADGSVRRIRSTNRLLRQYPWVQGMKTGYTNAAGKCLISCGSADGRAVIVVVLGSTSTKVWGESLKYLKWALGIA
ncbi:MAG: D-alanyl-D-alanine carboxypeptidase [Akkermansia sp.]|nr:D-alanyl-D-alanine carboxypeptidase [Akkermansia sp.]